MESHAPLSTEDGVVVGTLTQIPVESPSVIDRTMIDVQVSTAKQYPRSITRSLEEALTLATRDEETAESMFFLLERGGKEIWGPSARLAEIMAHTWGNHAVSAQTVDVGKKTVTAEATAWDMERNVGIRIRVERRITTRGGKRFNDDMILTTSNAAVSIAFRNAVFKCVPRTYVDSIWKKAMSVSVGGGKSIEVKRNGAVNFFSELGVDPEVLYTYLGVEGLDDIGEKEIIRLRGIANSVKEGERSVESIFGASGDEEKTDELNQALTEKDVIEEAWEKCAEKGAELMERKGKYTAAEKKKLAKLHEDRDLDGLIEFDGVLAKRLLEMGLAL